MKSKLQRRGARFVFKPTKLSIVTPVLDSHAVVRRQILHYKRMNLPDDIEIIFIDDNSDPPLKTINDRGLRNFYIYPTGDTRLWTIACARNLGIKIAQGEYIFNADVDHILPKEVIEAAYNFTGDKMKFTRTIAALDNKGIIRKDIKYLFKYGLSKRHYKKYGLRRYYHVATHLIRKQIIEELDGFPVRCCDYGTHPTREDRLFYHRYLRGQNAGKYQPPEQGPELHCFPQDDPKGLFHSLSRKTGRGYEKLKPLKSSPKKILKDYGPVPVSSMTRKRFDGDHTICQKLRDIYGASKNKDVKLNARIAMAMAKAMVKKMKSYKQYHEEKGAI